MDMLDELVCGAPPGRNSGRLVEMRHAHDLAMPLGHLLVEANTFETVGGLPTHPHRRCALKIAWWVTADRSSAGLGAAWTP
jgi:hypothetical protein